MVTELLVNLIREHGESVIKVLRLKLLNRLVQFYGELRERFRILRIGVVAVEFGQT